MKIEEIYELFGVFVRGVIGDNKDITVMYGRSPKPNKPFIIIEVAEIMQESNITAAGTVVSKKITVFFKSEAVALLGAEELLNTIQDKLAIDYASYNKKDINYISSCISIVSKTFNEDITDVSEAILKCEFKFS